MIRRPPRSTQSRSSAASDVYKRQSGIQIVGAGSGIDRAGQRADGILAVRALEEGDLLLLDEAEVGAALVNDDGIHRPVAQRRADGPKFLHVPIDMFVEVVHQDP